MIKYLFDDMKNYNRGKMKTFIKVIMILTILILFFGLFYPIQSLLLGAKLLLILDLAILILTSLVFSRRKDFLMLLKKEALKRSKYEKVLDAFIRGSFFFLGMAHGWYFVSILYLLFTFMAQMTLEKALKTS